MHIEFELMAKVGRVLIRIYVSLSPLCYWVEDFTASRQKGKQQALQPPSRRTRKSS